MFSRPLDLPLNKDQSSRFLPWIVALMVYLAALSLAVALTVGGVVDRWDRDLAGTLTVQIVPKVDPGGKTESLTAQIEADLNRALKILRETPGIEAAEPLSQAAVQSLLEPWLGKGELSAELVIPRLIDVSIDPADPPDVTALEKRLVSAVPGIALDDHRVWSDKLVHLAQWVRLVALGLVFVVTLAAMATVVFTTRSGMAVHHGIIEVLHLIGARDVYIARQFEFYALRQGLFGGLLGLVLALFTLIGLGAVAQGIDLPLLPALTMSLWQWLMIAALPVFSGLITMLTARQTVLRALAAMP